MPTAPNTPKDATTPPASPAPNTPSPGPRHQLQGTGGQGGMRENSTPPSGERANTASHMGIEPTAGSGGGRTRRLWLPAWWTPQAHGRRSGEADLTQPWLLSSQRHATDVQPQDMEEDAFKAPHDATIAAIGFVAVLIVNVAYVGYVTPPGGQDAYWLDCFYGTFFAYICLNGFALVFATASICAVAFGPPLLIWRRNPSWRQQVVKVGLFHLALSLISLLAAFAAAGFIVSGKWAPDPNCAKVLCSEGGVSCSAFAYRNIFLGVGDRTTPFLQRILSPEVAKLNNGSFSIGSDPDVTCQDYTYIANYTRIAELHPNQIVGGIQDASHGSVNDSCFILLSESVFGIQTSANSYRDPSTGLPAPKPNLYGMWCTRDGIPTGVGWLPLKLQRAADLVGAIHDQLGSKPNSGSQGYTFNSTAACPNNYIFDRKDVQLKDSVPAFQLLKDVHNPSRDSYMDPTYPTFSDNTAQSSEVDTALQKEVCQYALLMGWNAKGALSCPDTSMGIRTIGSSKDRLWPLGPAVYYPSLKYQCSGLVNGSLCVYGADPNSHLASAVDEDGNYLKRREASDKGSFYVHLGTNPTESRVYGAVIAMIAVALVAMLGTLALLGCLPYTGPSAMLRRLSGLCI